MSSKKDLLAKATGNTFGLDLYINNSTKSSEPTKAKEVTKSKVVTKKEEIKSEEKQDVVVKSSEPKVETKKVEEKVEKRVEVEVEEKEPLRMISLRLPISLIEKLNQYSYVARETQKDVVVMALEKVFNSKEGKEILSEYDNIKKK